MNKFFAILSVTFCIFVTSKAQTPYDPFINRIQLDPAYAPFYHGVASGDALTDRVIIWTRVTPDSTVTGQVEVQWKMATDTLFTQIVNQGIYFAEPSRDYTVKIDVTGLQPNTWYYYNFTALGRCSVTGRTKTAPTGDNDSIRFAVVTGSNYNSGFFNAYYDIAKRNDIDAVLHLGDYIYEYETNAYGDNPNRALEPPTEIVQLNDYRIRYAHYRLDPDLKYLHQQYPWYVIWDDHESANNSYKDGAGNHDPVTEGNWYERKENAVEAYLEWLPIREQDPNNPLKIYRNIKFGNLMDLIFLETRLIARDAQSMNINDPNKTMLGAEQYNWLIEQLKNSSARWKVIAQQVMMAPLATISQITVNTDQWDGYPKERERLLRFVVDSNINNFVVLTGDIHTSWANDLMYEPGTIINPQGYKSAGGEFITPSITSPSTNSFLGGLGSSLLVALIPQIKYSNLDKRGYMIFNLTKSRAQADWYLMDNTYIAQYHNYTIAFDDSWYLAYNKADRKIDHDGNPSVRTGYMPPLVSSAPCNNTSFPEYSEDVPLSIGLYPNPCNEQITNIFYTKKNKKLLFRIIDAQGRIVSETNAENYNSGIHYITFQTTTLVSGKYYIIALSNNKVEFKAGFIKN